MKIYGLLNSNNVRRAYAVARYLDLPVEHVDLNPFTPAGSSSEFRRMSPAGRIPAFCDGDFLLNESHAIMLYLAEQKPGTLWPSEPAARAEVMRWMSWSLAHWRNGWQPLQYERVIKHILGRGDPDAAVVEQAIPAFHQEAKLLDEHLDGRQWLVGNAVTLADFSVASGLSFAEPARLPLESYRNIRAWSSRMNAIPAWAETAPRLPPQQRKGDQT
ncbi:MAG: glutathione S-transferase family protein [Pseudonocardiaceae bacterium]